MVLIVFANLIFLRRVPQFILIPEMYLYIYVCYTYTEMYLYIYVCYTYTRNAYFFITLPRIKFLIFKCQLNFEILPF